MSVCLVQVDLIWSDAPKTAFYSLLILLFTLLLVLLLSFISSDPNFYLLLFALIWISLNRWVFLYFVKIDCHLVEYTCISITCWHVYVSMCHGWASTCKSSWIVIWLLGNGLSLLVTWKKVAKIAGNCLKVKRMTRQKRCCAAKGNKTKRKSNQIISEIKLKFVANRNSSDKRLPCKQFD